MRDGTIQLGPNTWTQSERALSQEALADKAVVDRSYMSGIERGVRNLSVGMVARIARALRVPVRDMFEE